MQESIAKLLRLVGIQYEFKLELRAFLAAAVASPLVSGYNVGANTPASRTAALLQFNQAGPAMSFNAKKAAYETLELVCGAIIANNGVSSQNADDLTDKLILATRYAGLPEGDGEDYNFMVAAYKLCAEIQRIAEDAIFGPIVTLTLGSGGSGFTTDGIDDTATEVVFVASSTEVSDPVGYSDASIEGTIAGGIITALTLVADGGEGFFVGQVIQLDIDTAAAGQAQGTQTTSATATVASISV